MHLAFALEYSLGHTTHARNLKAVLASGAFPDVVPAYIDLPFDATPVGAWAKLPLVRSNWSVRASLGAYLGLRRAAAAGPIDAALFHTQITSLFSVGFMRRVPSVISLDATPLQIDSLGAAYNHAPSGSGRIEAIKKRMNERAFGAARHLVTWSEWAKASLVADYGVPSAKITVIPPGIDTDLWDFGRRPTERDETVDLLFVGADFLRKGGDTLLKAYDMLPEAVRRRTNLHVVTKAALRPEALVAMDTERVRVYNTLTANSPELRALYERADLFVFPTAGDCLPLAVLEAQSSGLPVVTTAVGALAEAVRDGETGKIVPVGDATTLSATMEALIADPEEREKMGARARLSAVERYNAATNYRRLIETVTEGARR